MAHFAEIDDNNIVVQVLVIPDNEENRGQEFLANDLGLGGVWIQTSFNTRGGVHLTGGIPLRKNYAGIGYVYDSVKDAFIPPKPFASWVLDEDTCIWAAPTPYPSDGEIYSWNESALEWVRV